MKATSITTMPLPKNALVMIHLLSGTALSHAEVIDELRADEKKLLLDRDSMSNLADRRGKDLSDLSQELCEERENSKMLMAHLKEKCDTIAALRKQINRKRSHAKR